MEIYIIVQLTHQRTKKNHTIAVRKMLGIGALSVAESPFVTCLFNHCVVVFAGEEFQETAS